MLNEEQLAFKIRKQVSDLRATGRIPTEIRLGQDAWNTLRRQMTYASFGSQRVCQLDGLPCVLAIGVKPPGFRVTFVEGRD